jgi:hypothetical protein
LDIRSPLENCPLFSLPHFRGPLHDYVTVDVTGEAGWSDVAAKLA